MMSDTASIVSASTPTTATIFITLFLLFFVTSSSFVGFDVTSGLGFFLSFARAAADLDAPLEGCGFFVERFLFCLMLVFGDESVELRCFCQKENQVEYKFTKRLNYGVA